MSMTMRLPRSLIPPAIAVLVAVLLAVAATNSPALAAKSCGTFRVEGLKTAVHVRVVRGHTSCRIARAVLRSLFAHKRTHVRGWRCVGPQTGYSQCVRRSARIQGLF
jgi:hypothetical protein